MKRDRLIAVRTFSIEMTRILAIKTNFHCELESAKWSDGSLHRFAAIVTKTFVSDGLAELERKAQCHRRRG
jgi:hypothetical protein